MSERAEDWRDLARGRVPPNIKITKRSQFALATGEAERARVAPGEGIGDPHRPEARRRLSVAGVARERDGVDAEFAERAQPFLLELVAEDDAFVGGDV
jgi:hypothetical protein